VPRTSVCTGVGALVPPYPYRALRVLGGAPIISVLRQLGYSPLRRSHSVRHGRQSAAPGTPSHRHNHDVYGPHRDGTATVVTGYYPNHRLTRGAQGSRSLRNHYGIHRYRRLPPRESRPHHARGGMKKFLRSAAGSRVSPPYNTVANGYNADGSNNLGQYLSLRQVIQQHCPGFGLLQIALVEFTEQ